MIIRTLISCKCNPVPLSLSSTSNDITFVREFFLNLSKQSRQIFGISYIELCLFCVDLCIWLCWCL